MERIDKIVSNQIGYSRKEVKELIRQKRIKVNNKVISNSNEKIDETVDLIFIDNEQIKIKKYLYIILNKPKGYISASQDDNMPTVIDLIPKRYQHRNLFPAGRLDKDTTGMMIITDDGKFAHEILSPKKHVEKKYFVQIDKEITLEMIQEFQKGIILKEGICKPAKVEKITDNTGIVTITEGKYHQIKRMFAHYQAEVLNLKRLSMGNLFLPQDLKEGECRELTIEELQKIKE